jgi:hypothetical protein
MTILQNEELIKNVVEEIKQRLNKHHELYEFPVKAELWENTLANSLKACGADTDWKPDGGHGSGKDMTILSSGERISCKSGQLTGNNCKFNGSRTTKHKTLKEKLEFLSTPKDDVYFLLARSKKEWKHGQRNYYLVTFPSKILNYNHHQWTKKYNKRTAKHNGWSMVGEMFDALISIAMSHQLWTTLKNYKNNENVCVQKIELS